MVEKGEGGEEEEEEEEEDDDMVGKWGRNENKIEKEIHTCSLNCTTSAGVL